MSLRELESARELCRQELSALPGWALGSLVETEREQGGRRKPFRYLSRSSQARNRITYISEAQAGPLRQALEEGRKARMLLDRIADLTVAILKARTPRKEASA